VLSLLSFIYLLMTLYAIIYHRVVRGHEAFVTILIFTMLNSLVDVVFHTVFIIGAHKKNHRMIRMYNRYSVYNIIAVTAFFSVNMAIYMNIFVFFFLLKYVIFIFLTFIWTILLQLYLMVLVRSEVMKLKNNAQFQFVNNEAEAQCSATLQEDIAADKNDNLNVKTLQ
ncbi:hypothetical protein KGM_205485B, partial [Danaus plexippus plexippus]